MYFTTLDFVDTWEFLPSLHKRIGMFPAGIISTVYVRRQRSQDGGFVSSPDTRKWPELKALLSKLHLLGGATPVEFGSIAFELLMPDSTVPWCDVPDTGYAEAQLALRTNPQAIVYAGNEAAHLLPGAVTLISRAPKRAAVNFGAWPRIHLIVEFRLKGMTNASDNPNNPT
jgi:Aspartyl/Asparaginyl beta-hydroxylase